VDELNCQLLNAPPTCPHCGGLARPNVLMFSDDGWVAHRSAEQRRRQEAWLASVTRPVVVELGAGTAVPSVRHFSQRVLHQFGGRLVRINPREFEVPTRLDVGLPMSAAAGLAAIEQVLGWTR
jgi:NAD-dependent SIR2 family protein deacetylase